MSVSNPFPEIAFAQGQGCNESNTFPLHGTGGRNVRTRSEVDGRIIFEVIRIRRTNCLTGHLVYSVSKQPLLRRKKSAGLGTDRDD